MADPLKLRGEDEEDLAILSAVLQDALVNVGDMAYLVEERRFALVANRFRWERERRDDGHFERTLAGLAFAEVTGVQVRGFTPGESDRILQILAIRAAPGAILLEFSEGARMRLEVGRILCHLEDFGEPWPTRWQPHHPLDRE